MDVEKKILEEATVQAMGQNVEAFVGKTFFDAV